MLSGNQGNQRGNQSDGKKGGNQGAGIQGGGNQDRSSNRGFAAMDPQKQREISSKGGKAAHKSGNAHEFTSEEAREGGRKHGEASGGGRSRGGQGGNR